jgi:hypothetical protein
MLPGLNPALLMARHQDIVFVDVPQDIYISTAGGAGNRNLTLSVGLNYGTPPYSYSWTVSAGIYTPDPASGAGTTSTLPVSFTTQTYVDGVVENYIIVGEAELTVTDATGRTNFVRVPVAVGQ